MAASNEETLRIVFEAVGADAAASETEKLARSVNSLGAARTTASGALSEVARLAAQVSASLKTIPDKQKLGLTIDPAFAAKVREATALIEKLQGSKRIDIKATTNIREALASVRADLERVGALKKIEGVIDLRPGAEMRALARGGGSLGEVRAQMQNVIRSIDQQGARATSNVLQRVVAGLRSQVAGAAQAIQQFASTGAQPFGSLGRGAAEAGQAVGGVRAALAGLTEGGLLAGVTRIGLAFGAVGFAIGVAMEGLRKLGGVLGFPIQQAAEQEAASIRLQFALRGLGQFSEETQNRLEALAGTLQRQKGVTDDAVLGLQTMLIQIGRLSGDTLDQATRASLDLAAALGIDLQSAGFLVAKAAAGSTEALGRYGIAIDDSIPPAQRFAALLDLIATKFAGASEAQTRGFSGALNRLKISFGELAEEMGRPFLGPLATAFANAAAGIDRAQESLARLRETDTRTIGEDLDRLAADIEAAAKRGGTALRDLQERRANFLAGAADRIRLQIDTGDVVATAALLDRLGVLQQRAAEAGATAWANAIGDIRREASRAVVIRAEVDRSKIDQQIAGIQEALASAPRGGSATVKVTADGLDEVRRQVEETFRRVPSARVTVRADVKVDADIAAAVAAAKVPPITIPTTTEVVTIKSRMDPPSAEDVRAGAAAVATGLQQGIDANPPQVSRTWVGQLVDRFVSDFRDGVSEALRGFQIAGEATNPLAAFFTKLPVAAIRAKLLPVPFEEAKAASAQVAKAAPPAVIPVKIDTTGLSVEQIDEFVKQAEARLSKLDRETVEGARAAAVELETIATLNAVRNARIDRTVEVKGIEEVDALRESLRALQDSSTTATITPISPEALRNSTTFAESLARVRAEIVAASQNADVTGARLSQAYNGAQAKLSALAGKYPELKARALEFQAALAATVGPIVEAKFSDEQARAQVLGFRALVQGISGIDAVINIAGLAEAAAGIRTAEADLKRLPAAAARAFETGDLQAYQAVLTAIASADRALEANARAFSAEQVAALEKVRAAAIAVLPEFVALAQAQEKLKEIRLLVSLGRFDEAREKMRLLREEQAKVPRSLTTQVFFADAGSALPTRREEQQVKLRTVFENFDDAAREVDRLRAIVRQKPATVEARLDLKKAIAQAEAAGKQLADAMREQLVEQAKDRMAQAVGSLVADVFAAPMIALLDKTRTVFDVLTDAGKQFVATMIQELTRLAAFEFLKFLFPGAGAAGGFLSRAFGFGAVAPAPTPVAKAAPVPAPAPAAAPAAPQAPRVARPTPAREVAPVRPAARLVEPEAQVIRIPEPEIEQASPVVRLGIRIGELEDQTLRAPRVRFTVPQPDAVRLRAPRLVVPALPDVRARVQAPRVVVPRIPAVRLEAPKIEQPRRTTVRVEEPRVVRGPIPVNPVPVAPRAARAVGSVLPPPAAARTTRQAAIPAPPAAKPLAPIVRIIPAAPAPQRRADRGPAPAPRPVPPLPTLRTALQVGPAGTRPTPPAKPPLAAVPAAAPRVTIRTASAPPVVVARPAARVSVPVSRPDTATQELTRAARRLGTREQSAPRQIIARPATELSATAAFSREQARNLALAAASGRGETSRGFVRASSLFSDFLPRGSRGGGTTVNNIRAIDTRGVRASLAYGELGRAMAQQARRRG